jgi:L-histidine N-alpha-methyltransferase
MRDFFEHVKEGLGKTPKEISSRYFYDSRGDALYQDIMQLKEYYLPRCEMQIIENNSDQIAQDLSARHSCLQIVELGAGDGTKTKHMLKQFQPYFGAMEYVAMDISNHVLDINEKEIRSEIAQVDYKSIAGDYFETYQSLPDTSYGRLVLFLGANIGNYSTTEIYGFFRFIQSRLREDDCFLVAFDLVKNPRKILAAYDDNKGITKEFNLNLLKRMNRELGANFNIQHFDHFPYYNPLTGVASSQIVSLKKQRVEFSDGFSVGFDLFEAIHTEISKKFFWKDIEGIAQESQMHIEQTYFNSNKGYTFVMFRSN